VVGYLEGINLSKTDLDSKGRAFETFMGSFFRGDFGQYFTPRKIVEFVVNVLPIQHNSLVLDTSCGSGGFLLHALDKVRRQADEFYPGEGPSVNKEETSRHKEYWHDFASKNLFGIEINEQIARTAKMNMIIHDDGHTNVVACDGLLEDKDIQLRTHNRGFEYGKFDFIITNPPFGSTVKQTESAYLHQYRMSAKEPDWLSKDWGSTAWLDTSTEKGKRPNQSTEVLFIEQCHRFLRDGGYLAVVVPDGILTNSSLQYVRDNIEEMYRIVAVVSMPQTAFSATGAGVKSSVLFLKKHSEKEAERIRDAKEALKNEILDKNEFWKEHDRIQAAKNKHLKSLKGFVPPEGLPLKELPKSEAFQEWKKSVNEQYAEQLNAVKEKLAEQWETRRRTLAGDYDIFMAIAEDIGYDATGKPTGNNELEIIGQELARFIQAVEEDEA
jgi:type I restriction-modification system DNA methylase subunit